MSTSAFNRVLVRFRDDLSRPEYRAQNEALAALVARVEARGLVLRHDFGRAWENAHVLIELERLHAERPLRRVLDVGGGGSPVAYLLAERGFEVVVLDVDRDVAERVNRNAEALGLADRLSAVHGGVGPFPLDADGFDVALSISVFEGILRRHRAAHFAELRRVLRPGGSLLMTFDFGPGARFVGDPPRTAAEVAEQIVAASGMQLAGEPLREPRYDPRIGPPVKALVPTVDGHDHVVAAYSFAALHLRNG